MYSNDEFYYKMHVTALAGTAAGLPMPWTCGVKGGPFCLSASVSAD